LIFLVLVLTNYVPEVSVIHKERTLFKILGVNRVYNAF